MHSANKVEVRDPQTVLNTGHTVGEVVTGSGTVTHVHTTTAHTDMHKHTRYQRAELKC